MHCALAWLFGLIKSVRSTTNDLCLGHAAASRCDSGGRLPGSVLSEGICRRATRREKSSELSGIGDGIWTGMEAEGGGSRVPRLTDWQEDGGPITQTSSDVLCVRV